MEANNKTKSKIDQKISYIVAGKKEIYFKYIKKVKRCKHGVTSASHTHYIINKSVKKLINKKTISH